MRGHNSIRETFGFIADPDLPLHRNVARYLLELSPLQFFHFVTNKAFHNLCVNCQIPRTLACLLGNGLKFCLAERPAPKDLSDFDFIRFTRDIRTKIAVNRFGGNGDFEPKIYVRNPDWEPEEAPNNVELALTKFQATVHRLVRANSARFVRNLSRHELNVLRSVSLDKSIIVLASDKNLGPVVMDTVDYVTRVLKEHLTDTRRYTQLSSEAAVNRRQQFTEKMFELADRFEYCLSATENKYFERQRILISNCRAAKFYGIVKIHKNPVAIRPIVSCVNSELQILAKLLDYQLQKCLPLCPSYLRDGRELMTLLDNLGPLPADARFFTVDAVAMYDNIDTKHALESIRKWLDLHEFQIRQLKLNCDFILQGIELVMTNNVFEFDDLCFLQRNGTAMGASLSVAYATIYFSYHEETNLCKADADHGLLFYRRYIDDGIGIQLEHPGSHTRLLDAFNSFGAHKNRLEWTSSGLSRSITFLDLNLTIYNGSIQRRTYEKPLNLHLYIPFVSAHVPSVLKSLVHGQLLRFWQQNSRREDYVHFASSFYGHLLQRGYSRDVLDQQFHEAAAKLSARPNTNIQSGAAALANDGDRVFLHRTFHPAQIERQAIQHAFQEELSEPLAKAGLPSRLTIAQSRAPNLRDRFCKTALVLPEGSRASDHLTRLGLDSQRPENGV
jgi:hypothetical protein